MCWETNVMVDTKLYSINSFTYAHAVEADEAAVAFANAHNSNATQRVKKQRHHDENADRRARCVAAHGHTNQQERDELTRLMGELAVHPEALEGGLSLQLMPDFTHADMLWRTDKMPPDKYIRWQHKTTTAAVEVTGSDDAVMYRFSGTADYPKCLVVLSVPSQMALLWTVRGSTIGAREDIRIIQDVNDNTFTGMPGGDRMPTDIEGFVEVLLHEAELVVKGSACALPVCSMEEAEAELGSDHKVERRGFLEFGQCFFGGFVEFADTPLKVQDDPRILRQMENGMVVQYPDEQGGKVDLQIPSNWEEIGGTTTKIQFKTCCPGDGRSGYYCGLETAAGHDKQHKQLWANTYGPGDNDLYVVVLPSTESVNAIKNEVHFWVFKDEDMEANGLLASSDGVLGATGFTVYRDDVTNFATKHGWTTEFHHSFALDGATAKPTNAAAQEAVDSIAAQVRSKASKEAVTHATNEVNDMRARAEAAEEAAATALAAAVEARRLLAEAEQVLHALQEAEEEDLGAIDE